MGLTQFIAIVSALLSALIPTGSAEQIYSTIIACRFFLGIGLGGVYPLAATKAAEDASAGGTNPAASAKSFFWQTPGSLAPWLLALLFTATDLSANMKWRLLLGLGAIPGIIVFCCVLLENRERYNMTHKPSLDINDIVRKESVVAENMLHNKGNWYKLIGTGGSWFIFDVCYYGVGLFGGEILDAMGDNEDDDVTTDQHMVDTSWKQIVALGTGIPAIVATIAMMPYMSLKNLQIAGFFITAVGFLVMAVCFFPLKKHYPELLFAIYCFLLFALQFGPNVTTVREWACDGAR
jgi:MFS transporter, PHS family, inorganic phosphate transporter